MSGTLRIMPVPENTRFSYADTFSSPLRRSIVRTIERLSGQRKLKRLYDSYRASPRPDESFWEAAVRHLRINVRFDTERLDAVPKTGPLVVIANHPFGVLDGILLCWLIGRIRRDFKLLVHAALYQAPEAMPDLLPLDFSGGKDAATTILKSRATAINHLRAGGCLIVFPAGAVATTKTLFARRASDGDWGPFTAKLIRRSRAAVVPMRFEAQNSLLFQMASHVSYTVRLSLMFHETVRRIGTDLGVRIGAPVGADEMAELRTDEALIAYLRQRTEALATLPHRKPMSTIRGDRYSLGEKKRSGLLEQVAAKVVAPLGFIAANRLPRFSRPRKAAPVNAHGRATQGPKAATRFLKRRHWPAKSASL